MSRTYKTYTFPEGIKPDTLIAVPFKYNSQKDVYVFTDRGEIYEGANYFFDSIGTIRILHTPPEAHTLTVKRITAYSEKEPLGMVIAELRDELPSIDEDIDNKILTSESKSDEKINRCHNRLDIIRDLFHALTDKTEQQLKSYIDDEISGTNTILIKQQSDIQSLRTDIAGMKGELTITRDKEYDELKKTIATLTRDHSSLIRYCLDRLVDTDTELTNINQKLDTHINAPAPMLRALTPTPITSTHDDTGKLLDETRTALNFETQIRRREDAQIKALLKRLLDKYERLEDWIAGIGGDITDNVLNDLRAEMRAADDTIGRTTLENIVRINKLKERVLNV